MRHGWASPYVNTIDFNIAFGVNIGGKLYGRLDDVLAIGITSVHTTKAYRDVKKLVGISADVFETTIELTYMMELYKSIALQPDLQYIINPGADPMVNDALVFATRLQISL